MNYNSIMQTLFNEPIKQIKVLSGGFSFKTFLVQTQIDNFVVRIYHQTEVENKLVVSVFHKEALFYQFVNQENYELCPKVVRIVEYNDMAIQILNFINGTPLNQCIAELDQKKIHYQMGRLAAQINNIVVGEINPLFRTLCWKAHFRIKLIDRLNSLISLNKIKNETLINLLKKYDSFADTNQNHLLHLDIRYPNIIFKRDNLFLIDAENCEVGDPLYELAIIDISGVLDKAFMDGYQEQINFEVDLNSIWYKFYKLERYAALVKLFSVNFPQPEYEQYNLKEMNLLLSELNN